MRKDTSTQAMIQRATERLTQLQAREILAQQRKTLKLRQEKRREMLRRRQRVADLVNIAGGLDLPDGEIVTALLRHREHCISGEMREEARRRGEAYLTVRERSQSLS